MKKKNNENKYKIFLFIFQHFVNEQPSDQYPDPCPATGGLVFEARRRPKKRKIETTDDTEVPSNSDSTVVIPNIPAHDTQNDKECQTEEAGTLLIF